MKLGTDDLAREHRRDLLIEAERRRLIAEARRPRRRRDDRTRPAFTPLRGSSFAWVRSSWPR